MLEGIISSSIQGTNWIEFTIGDAGQDAVSATLVAGAANGTTCRWLRSQ